MQYRAPALVAILLLVGTFAIQGKMMEGKCNPPIGYVPARAIPQPKWSVEYYPDGFRWDAWYRSTLRDASGKRKEPSIIYYCPGYLGTYLCGYNVNTKEFWWHYPGGHWSDPRKTIAPWLNSTGQAPVYNGGVMPEKIDKCNTHTHYHAGGPKGVSSISRADAFKLLSSGSGLKDDTVKWRMTVVCKDTRMMESIRLAVQNDPELKPIRDNCVVQYYDDPNDWQVLPFKVQECKDFLRTGSVVFLQEPVSANEATSKVVQMVADGLPGALRDINPNFDPNKTDSPLGTKLPWGLIILGGSAVLLFGYWYWKKQNQHQVPQTTYYGYGYQPAPPQGGSGTVPPLAPPPVLPAPTPEQMVGPNQLDQMLLQVSNLIRKQEAQEALDRQQNQELAELKEALLNRGKDTKKEAK